MNKVYVLGGAQTDFGRNWTKEGKNVIALLSEVIDDGLKDVGLTYEEIKVLNNEGKIACFMANFIGEYFINQGHLGALLTEVNPAFYGVPSARYEAACASGSVALDSAISKIISEDYDVAIVVGWELMKTVDSKTCGDYLGRAAYYSQECEGIEFPFPKLFGKLADETIKKYNLNEKEYLNNLAKISAKNYCNAKRNPNAQTKKWFMNEEQAMNRGTDTNAFVGGKLAISDCSQVTDGAAVVVLVSEKYLKKNNLSNEYPRIKGWGHRVAPMIFEKKINDNKDSNYILPWTRQAVIDAYNKAQMTIESIDFFETHDCFTSSEYVAISAFGIEKPGEENNAIEKGRTSFYGDKPINPGGGLIGVGHPVGASGIRMFLDIYKQVARKAGLYQLEKANNGMMLNLGGSATTNYVFIIGNDRYNT